MIAKYKILVLLEDKIAFFPFGGTCTGSRGLVIEIKWSFFVYEMIFLRVLVFPEHERIVFDFDILWLKKIFNVKTPVAKVFFNFLNKNE